ncbi:MAG: ShlB/FhaC/HecB family hemolysin secretion/activation protein, partial [Burkholderiales bacterium]
ADVDSGLVSEGTIDVSGEGTIFGARLNKPLQRLGNYEHKLVGGVDYRAYSNTVTVVGVGGPSLVPDITIHPLSLTYAGQWKVPGIQADFYVTGVANFPFGNDGRQNDFEIDLAAGETSSDGQRVEGDADYKILRYGGNFAKVLPRDWQMRLSFSAQRTTDALVPGEQFGLGGRDSIRGFHERTIANDEGYRVGGELYTPDFGPWTNTHFLQLKDGFRARALFFYELGDVYRNHIQVGEQSSVGIASVGLGLRAALGKNVNLRLDYGRIVDAGGDREDDDERLHTSLGVTF